MNRLYSKVLISFFAILLVVTACKKDEPIVPEEEVSGDVPYFNEESQGTLNLGVNITADFIGEIRDESGQKLSGVTVTIGNKTDVTDANGVFVIAASAVSKDLAYIQAEKPGYFNGSRSVLPTTTTSNFIKIMMMPLEVAGTVTPNTATTIQSDGAAIDFNGQFVDESGNYYTGSVNVAMKYLPAMGSETYLKMPGMLYAENSLGEARALITYGMMAVELLGSSGQSLQLAGGSVATIHIPVEGAMISNAPATIPLWHFDEVAGYWVEEGSATLIGNEYVGEVDHFSFWNCDLPSAVCEIHGQVQNSQGTNTTEPINITFHNSSFVDFNGFTNLDGSFFTYMPSDKAYDLVAYPNCGQSSAVNTIGPYSQNSINNEVIIVDPSGANYFNVTGVLKDCNGIPIPLGYVLIEDGPDSYYSAVNNGIFDIQIYSCSLPPNVEVNCYAYLGDLVGTSFVATVTAPTTVVGVVELCNPPPTSGAYITRRINNGVLEVFTQEIEYNDFGSYFSITDSLGSCMIQSHNVMAVGSYAVYTGTDQNTVFTLPTWYVSMGDPMEFYVLIDKFEGPGGWIHLTAFGTYGIGLTESFEMEAQAYIP